MAARKEFPVKVRRVAVTNKKTGVKYIGGTSLSIRSGKGLQRPSVEPSDG